MSFQPAISLAIDPSFNQDQDILVLPLDLLKYDTHEKLGQDVLNHFGKVTSDKSQGIKWDHYTHYYVSGNLPTYPSPKPKFALSDK